MTEKKENPKKKTKKQASNRGPKNLVVVESPAKSKTIKKFLGRDFQVEASMGHVRDLPKSKMGVDPEKDFTPHYVIVAKSRKTVGHLKKQAKGKQRIYLAPDPDREGEAISWHLAHIFNEVDDRMAVERVVFNEITKNAVLEAFRHTRTIDMNLVNAQQARRILDRVVGYELSPLLWRNVGRGLSAGRVQTVALRLIVDREREIRKFVPQEYWSIEAKLSSGEGPDAEKLFWAKLDKIGSEKADLKNRDQTKALREEILKLPFRVAKIEKKERKRSPQAPYTTSKLQQEAYNRLGFPAAKTMQIAQRLYEGIELGGEGSVGLITYMRTDSVHVSTVAQKEAAEYIRGKFGKDYLPDSPPVYRSKKGAQEAHEAIRPTYVSREPGSVAPFLSEDENKLYALIWKKFIASQMLAAVDEVVSLSLLAGEKFFFRASGKRNLFPGFLAVFAEEKAAETAGEKSDADEEPEGTELPELKEGQILKLHQLMGYQHFTKPPARYNDASLVKTLEEEGIGRPSTYAPTLYTLIQRDYVSRRGGALQPTELGETVVDSLVKFFPDLLSAGFTAEMEEELDKIEEGKLDWVHVLKDFYRSFQENVKTAREFMENHREEPVVTEHQCDVCSKPMVIRKGRFGQFLACSGFPECKYTRSIPTGFRCPEPDCGGDLVRKRSHKGNYFYGCSKYPKCTHIANKLPGAKDEKTAGEDAKPAEKELEVLGP